MKTGPNTCIVCLALVLVSASVFPAVDSAARGAEGRSAPDWAQAREEAVRMLSDMIKIDTSNPPGNEAKVARYVKSILDEEGIPSEILEQKRGRGNVIARLRGSGKKRPILLMGHTDVVGVERDKWTVDPFAAVVKDGYLYGRGASDNKDNVAVYLEVFLLLHRLKVPLDRDVIFLAQAGEEGTPSVGMNFLVAEHWDKIACEFALDEGGSTRLGDGRVDYVGISTSEKVPRGIRLIARGTSGHGSVPRADNAITHLASALAKVGTFQMPMRLNETTRAFFERLAAISPPEEKYLYTHLEDPVQSEAVQEKIRATNPRHDSTLRTSISPTIIEGGFRSNVIPAEAEAFLDVRVLPDEDVDAMVATLRRLIDDPAVEVVGPRGGRPRSRPSSMQTDMFRALERAQERLFPDAVTLPIMLTGATDMAQLRAKGVQAYGLGTPISPEDAARIHGHDERISVEGIGQFVTYVYHAVTDVAGAKSPPLSAESR